MKQRVNEFVDLFPKFQSLGQTAQIVRLAYFHAVEEGRESVNRDELANLFRLSSVPIPENLPQLLTYLSGKGKKLINTNGEFSLRREVRKEIEQDLRSRRGSPTPVAHGGSSPFDFGGKTFTDAKIAALLEELKRCYPQECWNSCGLLIRIVIERTLDTTDPAIKGKTGLRDKLNGCRGLTTLSKSLKEALDGLHGAKIIGDIAAHHSKILLDKNDVNLALPAFRVLIKEVTTI
jgi:hypothetical protein